MTDKRIYDSRGMKELGFTERTIRKLSKSERLSEFGFRMGTGRTAKVYFILPKVEKYLENQMDDWGEIRE